MFTELAFIQIILDAGLLVQVVMITLILASLISWVVIFRKRSVLGRARKRATQFEDQFWRGRDLNSLYTRITKPDYQPAGMERIFEAGYTEFARLRKQAGINSLALLEGVQRAMRVALNREVEALEHNLSVLASIGSVSPYIGLFGTVWGIMHSFHALADVQQATLQMVAPGISEALIATALGLVAAIPAVLAYNLYVTDVDRLSGRYEAFVDEFTGILQRQTHLMQSPREE